MPLLKLWAIRLRTSFKAGFFISAILCTLIFKFAFWDIKMGQIEKRNSKVLKAFVRNENCHIFIKEGLTKVIYKKAGKINTSCKRQRRSN